MQAGAGEGIGDIITLEVGVQRSVSGGVRLAEGRIRGSRWTAHPAPVSARSDARGEEWGDTAQRHKFGDTAVPSPWVPR